MTALSWFIMVVKLSLRFFRGLLVAGSHRIADPKWPSPPQSGSSRTGFPAGICWHLSLPGNDYWQLHILSFCFFQTYQRIAPEKHCRQLLHVTSCKRLSGQKQVTEAWIWVWALKLSASDSKHDNLYAGCDVGCLYNTDELLSNAVFFPPQFLNDDFQTEVENWYLSEDMGKLWNTRDWTFEFAASHCFLLCYFVVETGHNATLLAVQLFFFFFTIFVGISGHELVHMLESNPHKIWQVYIHCRPSLIFG